VAFGDVVHGSAVKLVVVDVDVHVTGLLQQPQLSTHNFSEALLLRC
jgi:hypothetical protein